MLNIIDNIDKDVRVELLFARDDEYIKSNDLQGFLFYLGMYYKYISQHGNGHKINDIESFKKYKRLDNEYFINKYYYYNYLKNLYKDKNHALLIYEIDKHSPLKIILGGSFSALIGALILAGGEIDIEVPNVKAKIVINKSLGEALKDLQSFRER